MTGVALGLAAVAVGAWWLRKVIRGWCWHMEQVDGRCTRCRRKVMR